MSESNFDTTPPVGSSPRKSRAWLWIKIPAALIAFAIVFEALFLAWCWIIPPWSEMRDGKIPASALIKDYESQKEDDPKLPALRWKPIVRAVPKHVSKVFIFAEDSRFYEHDGFDYEAIAAAMQYNWKKGKILRGASTISQQTAKNLFLSLSRNPLRKWHEVLLTYMLEAKLNKAQILHAYLNVAEFGKGIYGIEAAAQAYYHKPASALSQEQAVALAATLPSPKKHNPQTQTRAFAQRTRRVSSAIRMVDQYLVQRGKKDTGATSALPTDAELAEKLREVMADPASEKTELDEPATEETADDREAAKILETTKPEEMSGEALEAAGDHLPADTSPPVLPPEEIPAPDAPTETPAPEPSPEGSTPP